MKLRQRCVLSSLLISATLLTPGMLAGQTHRAREPSPFTGERKGASPFPGVRNYDKLPLSFEPNVGQTDPQVQFISHGKGYELFLTEQEIVLSLNGPRQLDARYSKRAPINRIRQHL